MSGATWRVRVGAHETTAVWDPAEQGAADSLFIYAHGAGGHLADRLTLAACDVLRQQGLSIVRFNFLYREQRRSRPDPMPALLECLNAVIDRVRQELTPKVLIVGGRSMGGRAASMLVAENADFAGLLLLAYPLHPPGKPDQLRTAHLPAIRVPVLCINGTRDPFCDRALMEQTLSGLGSNWRMHWLEGADHSFHVLKSSGRTDRDVLAEVGQVCGEWTKSVARGSALGSLHRNRDQGPRTD